MCKPCKPSVAADEFQVQGHPAIKILTAQPRISTGCQYLECHESYNTRMTFESSLQHSIGACLKHRYIALAVDVMSSSTCSPCSFPAARATGTTTKIKNQHDLLRTADNSMACQLPAAGINMSRQQDEGKLVKLPSVRSSSFLS